MCEATPPRNKNLIAIASITSTNFQNEQGQRQVMDEQEEQPDQRNDCKSVQDAL